MPWEVQVPITRDPNTKPRARNNINQESRPHTTRSKRILPRVLLTPKLSPSLSWAVRAPTKSQAASNSQKTYFTRLTTARRSSQIVWPRPRVMEVRPWVAQQLVTTILPMKTNLIPAMKLTPSWTRPLTLRHHLDPEEHPSAKLIWIPRVSTFLSPVNLAVQPNSQNHLYLNLRGTSLQLALFQPLRLRLNLRQRKMRVQA